MEEMSMEILRASAEQLDRLADTLDGRQIPRDVATDAASTLRSLAEIIRVEQLRKDARDRLEDRVKALERMLGADTYAGEVTDVVGHLLDLHPEKFGYTEE